MSIVVTGAGGYVGGRLVDHLGSSAVPMLRTPKPWLPDAAVVDLLHDDLAPRFEGADAVVHLAGASEVRFGGDEAEAAHAETVETTDRVGRAARAAGVPRLVFLSTFHVYGGLTDDGVVHERVEPHPQHLYARSRLEGERRAAGFGPDHHVTLRLTNSIGPPVHPAVDRWTLVANDLCAQAAAGGPVVLRSSGHAGRDFVDLGEVCRVIGEAATGSIPTGTYNLGSGMTTRVLDLAHLVADAAEEVLGARPPVEAPPHEGPEPPPFRVSIEALAEHVDRPDPDLRPALVATLRLLSRSGSGDGQP
ncbi:MAG TPA: NAD(P)-dependent oxidoreductase [Iamia sp.]|nr:NAD(P)-dependent oxidoreductase [Iamia sp.]